MAMKDGRRNNGTSKHAGVVLSSRTLPSGATSWRARFTDPDTQKLVYETLPKELTTETLRAAWAVRKAETIGDRRLDIAKGAATKKALPIADAIKAYFTSKPSLRAKTVRRYRQTLDKFQAWALKERIETTDDIRPEELGKLSAYFGGLKKRVNAKGSFRTAPRVDGALRSRHSVARDVRGLRAFLGELHDAGLLPLVPTRDMLRTRIKAEKAESLKPKPLTPAEVKAIVETAARRDLGQVNKHGPKGAPMTSLVIGLLLTGMRAEEAMHLRWNPTCGCEIDLDYVMPGSTGKAVGRIFLAASCVKTKKERTVDLSVSPLLREMLQVAKIRAGSTGPVFGLPGTPWDYDTLSRARRALAKTWKGPRFEFQDLRVTCACYLVCAPGIFAAGSVFRESKQLGHSVTIAATHYLEAVYVDPAARTLEAAMGVEDALRRALNLPVASVLVVGATG